MKLEQDYCMSILEPHFFRLHESWHNAFDRYQSYPAEIKAQHDDRAVTSCIHAHVIHEIRGQFAEVRGVKLLNIRRLNVLNIQNKLVLRFKKVDEAGRSSSFRTHQQENFDKQLPLPGLPQAATRLTIGYEPDVAFSEIVRVLVSCPHGESILWASQINQVDGEHRWADITPRRLAGTEAYRRYDELENEKHD